MLARRVGDCNNCECNGCVNPLAKEAFKGGGTLAY